MYVHVHRHIHMHMHMHMHIHIHIHIQKTHTDTEPRRASAGIRAQRGLGPEGLALIRFFGEELYVHHPSGPNPRGQPPPPRRPPPQRAGVFGFQFLQTVPPRALSDERVALIRFFLGKGSWRNRLQKSESKNTRAEVAAYAEGGGRSAGVRAGGVAHIQFFAATGIEREWLVVHHATNACSLPQCIINPLQTLAWAMMMMMMIMIIIIKLQPAPPRRPRPSRTQPSSGPYLTVCEQEEGCSKHAFYRTEAGARPEYCAAHRKVSYLKAMYPISRLCGLFQGHSILENKQQR
jgi:hypothetical protein